jgi:predicted nuclease of restriction endonuclease-like (RecB) superfamily
LLSRLFLVPWGHHIHILTKSNSEAEALFYVNQVIANHWSREQLSVQMEQNLFARQGKAITNFAATLPPNEAAHAQLLLKDPYNFGFLQLDAQASELHIEVKLTEQITRFLLELGKGFAFLGRQVPLNVGSKEYRLDLLFYHVKLRCYVVIELKAGPFEPEFAGKMNFYLSAVDDQFRHPADNPSIGILLCRGKDRLEVEYALRDIQKPIGVSDFLLTPDLPVNLEDALPTVEDFENRIHLTD